MLTKQCPRCGQNKGINYFYKEDGRGWTYICHECRDALFKNKPPSSKGSLN